MVCKKSIYASKIKLVFFNKVTFEQSSEYSGEISHRKRISLAKGIVGLPRPWSRKLNVCGHVWLPDLLWPSCSQTTAWSLREKIRAWDQREVEIVSWHTPPSSFFFLYKITNALIFKHFKFAITCCLQVKISWIIQATIYILLIIFFKLPNNEWAVFTMRC